MKTCEGCGQEMVLCELCGKTRCDFCDTGDCECDLEEMDEDKDDE